jgi:hypothetical protein
MPDESDRTEFSESEITAMRYAYRQLLVEHPERFPDIRAKQDLAESVVELLEGIKSIAANDIGEVVALIMEDNEQ